MSHDSLHFEVGCVTFQRDAETIDADYTSTAYANEIQQLLESLPMVSDVSISGIRSFKLPSDDNWTGLMAVARRPVEITSHYFMNPHPVDGRVFFRIRIPIRMQKELASRVGGGTNVQIKGEEFEVLTYFTYHWPVAYVRCLDSAEHRPMLCFFIREFLRRELEARSNGSTLRLEFIGPSPFHGSFSLIPAKDELNEPFVVERTPSQHGYDKIAVRYSTDAFPDNLTAYLALQSAVADEFGLYYSISRYGEHMEQAWYEIESSTADVVEIARAKGLRAYGRRLFRLGGHTRDLSLQLFALESEASRESVLVERALAELSSGPGPHLIEMDLRRETDEAFRPRDVRAGEVVKYIEGRRTHEVSVLLVLVAAAVGFLGGIGGALLTAVVQSGG